MTFYSFIRAFLDEDSAMGDLARDIIDDPDFPKRYCRKDKIKNYLEEIGACEKVFEVFKVAYDLYVCR